MYGRAKVAKRVRRTFSHHSGNQTAADLFCRLFTEEVWDLIVSETNGHAETFLSTTPTNGPSVSVSVPEMKAFIGLLVLRGH